MEELPPAAVGGAGRPDAHAVLETLALAPPSHIWCIVATIEHRHRRSVAGDDPKLCTTCRFRRRRPGRLVQCRSFSAAASARSRVLISEQVVCHPRRSCRHWGSCAGAPLLLLQELPPRSYTGADTVAWLRDSLLTLRLEGTAAADVAVSGAQGGGATRCPCVSLLLATLSCAGI